MESRPLDRDEAYDFVRRTRVRRDYDALYRVGKGTVREFLGKATGWCPRRASRFDRCLGTPRCQERIHHATVVLATRTGERFDARTGLSQRRQREAILRHREHQFLALLNP